MLKGRMRQYCFHSDTQWMVKRTNSIPLDGGSVLEGLLGKTEETK